MDHIGVGLHVVGGIVLLGKSIILKSLYPLYIISKKKKKI